MTIQPIQSPALANRGELEHWEMQTNATLYLSEMDVSPYGQPIKKEIKVGPGRSGSTIQIWEADGKENQRHVFDKAHDPFRNGTLVRVDKSQQDDEATASPEALTLEEVIAILDLEGDAFEQAATAFNEVTTRRLLEIATSMDVGHKKVVFLEELIAERYASGAPQKSLSGDGERLS